MNDFFIYLLKSAGLLGLFFIFYTLLLKQDTSFETNRKFLLGGLLASAILPAVYFTQIVFVEAQTSHYFYTEGAIPVSEAALQDPTFSLTHLFFALYAFGVVIMLGRLCLQLFSLAKVLFSGKVKKQKDFTFIESPREIAPFSFFRYIVYNPNLHSQTELDLILKHEQVHVSHRHTIDVLLGNLSLIFQWFNPFAWFYLKNLQQNLEFIADSEAVKQVSCKKEYQKTLLRISVENLNPGLTNNFFQSLIKKRIMMLNKPASGPKTTWKPLLILPALFAFLLFFNINTVAQVKEKDQETETVQSDDLEISFNITEKTKQEQLDGYRKLANSYDVQLIFEDVVFNDNGDLIKITAGFLDRNNNSTGSISRNNTGGIEPFTFYYKRHEGSGFKKGQVTNNDQNIHKFDLFKDLGKEPLYVINGETYSHARLEGKYIRLLGELAVITPPKAIEQYGNAAKNGALVISKGEIIEDFKAALKKIDKENTGVKNDYLKIEKGEHPARISVDKNMPVTSSREEEAQSTGQKTGKVESIKDLETGGKNPLYVLNGEIVTNADTINLLNPEQISSINVLKGYSATSLYGDRAIDAAVIITTKADTTTSVKHNFSGNPPMKMAIFTQPTFKENRGLTITSHRSEKGSVTEKDSSIIKLFGHDHSEFLSKASEINAFQVGTKSSPNHSFLIPRQENEQILILVDGKEMEKGFDMNSIDPENIKSINVLKGPKATSGYGEKGKNGIIDITLKKNKK